MKTVIVSCRTLEDEVAAAIAYTHTDFPVFWIESGLHNTPKTLTSRLQETLREIHADRVLLAMGFCGNALAGLQLGKYETVIPRVDDCISLLLGSMERRHKISSEMAAYFFTEGWLRGERNIWVEYQYSLEKYGKETAEEIMQMMYSHYDTLALLESGIHPIELLEEKTKEIAEVLHLRQKRVTATLDYLCELIRGPWPENRFLILPPGHQIRHEDLILRSGAAPLQ